MLASYLNPSCQQSSLKKIVCWLRAKALMGTAVMLCACSALSGMRPTNLTGDDYIVVPGERVGLIRLGMSEQDLLKLGGSPEGPVPSPVYRKTHDTDRPVLDAPGILYKFGEKMIWVYLDRSNRQVVKIDLGYHGDCGAYHTAEGVRCGSSVYGNIVGAIGEPDNRRAWDFGHHQLMEITYFNNYHSPRSLTVFNFDPGQTMDVAPVDELQDISLKVADYE